MPSIVAFLVIAGLVGWLFWDDRRRHGEISAALWIPIFWFFINCSRTVAQWLVLFGFNFGGSYEEGTPMDAAANLVLLLMALAVLRRRAVRLREVFVHNRLLIWFFVYCLVSVLWSDDPFISLKRWIKVLGHPAMALVVLTELNPQRAFVALMKRCAFVFVPFSILFIKYYPQWGRGFDGWSGLPSNTGVTTNKNILGCGCFIFGFFFVWHILQHWSQRREEAARREVIVSGVLLLATLWLMYLAHSSTALGTFVMAVGMLLFSGLRFVTSRNIGKIVITGALTFFVANSALGLVDQAIALLGRDPTLTDRTKIWREVLKFDINPVLGTGFEDFWNEPRRAVMRQIFFWEPNQAHNGYLETYLCLGLIGLAFMFFLLLTAFFRSARRLEINRPLAQYGLGFIAGYAVYNWTEAAFKALHPMWFVFFLVLMEFPPMAGVAEVSGEPDLPAAGEAKRT